MKCKRVGRGGLGCCLAGTLVLLALTSSARADTFYVRTSGNDQHDGRTPATAFASIETAIESVNSLLGNAGDRIVVGPGVYHTKNLTPRRNGIEGRPIVIRADTSGGETGDTAGSVEIAVSTGAGQLNSGFIIYGTQYVVIDGFTISGATDPGIQIRPEPVKLDQSSHITLINNTVRDGAKTGIEIQSTGSDIVVQGNTVQNNHGSGISVNGPGGGNVHVDTNHVLGNADSGILLENVNGGTIAGNEVRTNGGIGIQVRSSEMVLVRGNTLDANGGEAICTGCGLDSTTAVRDVGLESNSILANGSTGIHVIGGGTIRLIGNTLNAAGVGVLLAIDEQADVSLESNVVDSATQDAIVVRRAMGSASSVVTPAMIALSTNTARSSHGYGISLGRTLEPLAQVVLAHGNQLTGNSSGGIEMFTQADVSVTDNTSTGNGGSGISSEIDASGAMAEISRNHVMSNAAHGIFLNGAASGNLDRNTIEGNQLNGILVEASNGLTVTRNIVRNNEGGIASGIEPGLLGDCNRDGVTSVNDLVTGVAIALRQESESACPGLSVDADSTVDIVDLVMAVSVAASGVMTHGLGENAEISDNTVENHAKFGIVAFAKGKLSALRNNVNQSRTVGLSATADELGEVVVRGNMIATSGADGILLTRGETLTVDSNRINGSSENGLRIVAGGQLAVTQNQITGSGKSGVVAQALGEVSVADNKIAMSGAVGLSLQPQSGRQLHVAATGNQISVSLLGGMVVEATQGGTISDNTISATATGDGITLLRSSAVMLNGNTLSDTKGHGIVVGSEMDAGADFVLSANRIARSMGSGINLWGSKSARVLDNQVLKSGTAGVSVRMLGPRATSVISGNTVGSSGADGVSLFGTVRATIQNNVLFSNGEAGLLLRGAPNSSVINNLIYANARFGVAAGTGDDASIASPNAVIVTNTIYQNGQFGIVIGTSSSAMVNGMPLPQSPGALIVDNAFANNGLIVPEGDYGGGIGITSGSLRGLVTGFNVNPDGYGDGIRISPYDHFMDPAFVDPDGADNVLGGDGYEDDDFRLRRTPVDQRSPAIDAGSGLAADIGITGSCLQGAGNDSGVIDVCFHYNASADQIVHVSIPDLPMYSYVRQTGDSANDGLTPQRALDSILTAAVRAAPGSTVVVGPGTYHEGDLHVRDAVNDVTFLADPSGKLTGDMPGPVLIDPAGCQRCTDTATGMRCVPCDDTAFVLVDTPNITIDGFHITGTRQAGIQVRAGSGGAVVRNNVVFSNAGRGIEALIGGSPQANPEPIDGVQFINNLVYANGSGGMRMADTVNGMVLNNTVYGNGVGEDMSDALLIGGAGSQVPTRGVVLMRNIVLANRDVGIKVETNAREGYVTGFNFSLGLTNPLLGYAGSTPRADSDFLTDALLVNPAGADGILGGTGFADDDFHLQQGSGVVSPAVDVDLGEVDALKDGSTSSDGKPDTGPADAGYHYPLAKSAQGVTP